MKIILLIVVVTTISFYSFCQNIAITDDESHVADPSAILDVKASDKGFLMPRLTTDQRNAVASPAIGLQVYDTDEKAIFFYDGSAWTKVVSGTGTQDIEDVLLLGNDANGNSIVNMGQIGVGTETPSTGAAIEINSVSQALILSRMTTAQRDAIEPISGMIIFNTDSAKFQGFTELPSEVSDQVFETYNNAGGGNRAQSFTAGITGQLTKVDLLFSNMSSSDVTIKILEGEGTSGTELFSQTVTVPSCGWTWYQYPITGVDVISGNKFTIQVIEVDEMSCGMPPCWHWALNDAGGYPDGMFFYAGSPYPGYDSVFRTYVTTGGEGWVNLH